MGRVGGRRRIAMAVATCKSRTVGLHLECCCYPRHRGLLTVLLSLI